MTCEYRGGGGDDDALLSRYESLSSSKSCLKVERGTMPSM